MSRRTRIKRKPARALVAITGCDSGIGRALAELFAARGHPVAASFLQENPFDGTSGVQARQLDVRRQEDVDAWAGWVRGLCVDGVELATVISNAGVALGGPIEDLPLDVFRECFEVNFFGSVRVVQAFIPDLIRTRGTIAVMGSLAGRVAMPFLSPYVSTKFALEGFCDSLRREMNPFGVRTVLFEPGGVATPIWNKAKAQDVSFVSATYLDSLDAFRDNFIEGGNRGMPADDAARIMADLLAQDHLRPRYVIAGDRGVSQLLPRVPASVMDRVVARLFRMDYGRPRPSASVRRAGGSTR